MTRIQVHVAIGGQDVPAGILYSHRRRGVGSATFTYASGYLTTPGAYSLDPELPLSGGARQTRIGSALFGSLADCAPDRWGRTLLTRHEAALARAEHRTARSLGEIDYVLGVRDDLRQALLAMATRSENDTADLPGLQRLIQVGSSLGGARPKAHVRDINGRISIAEFPSAAHDTWNVMAWEKVALDLAHQAGPRIPPRPRRRPATVAGLRPQPRPDTRARIPQHRDRRRGRRREPEVGPCCRGILPAFPSASS